jgi:hypothetical protein
MKCQVFQQEKAAFSQGWKWKMALMPKLARQAALPVNVSRLRC